MAVVTKYICDRCKAEHADPREMFVVGIGLYWVTQRPENQSLSHQQLWCDGCLRTVGIRTEPRKFAPGVPEPARPTFESMLRAIIREEIENA